MTKVLLRARVGTIATLLFVSACLSTRSPERAATLAGLQAKPASTRAILGSTRFQPTPFRGGQFVHYLITNADRSLTSYRVQIVKPGDLPFSYWLEEELFTEDRYLMTRNLIVMDDSRIAVASQDPEKYEPVITDFSRVVRVLERTEELGPYVEKNLALKDSLPAIDARISLLGSVQLKKNRKSVVKAGVFKACFDAISSVTFGGKPATLNACLDAQVPLHGIVDAKDSQGRRWELLDYGVAAPSVF